MSKIFAHFLKYLIRQKQRQQKFRKYIVTLSDLCQNIEFENVSVPTMSRSRLSWLLFFVCLFYFLCLGAEIL